MQGARRLGAALVVALTGCAAQLGAQAPQTTADTPANEGAVPATPAPSFGPPAGFTVDGVPAVPALAEPEVTMGAIDLELLRKLKRARTLDRDVTAAPADKAAAWRDVADHAAPANPYATLAGERVEVWSAAADARDKRKAAIGALREKLLADRAELERRTKDASVTERTALEASFLAAYAPYADEIATWTDLGEIKAGPEAPPPPPKELVSPVYDPTGIPVVRAQRFVIKWDFGAHAQSFSVDTDEDLISSALGRKPSYDLSGFYAGGQATVHIAEQSELSIGVTAYGRYHVTTTLPADTYVSGEEQAATLAPPDGDRPGAFAVGAGARLAGNVTERIAMVIGLTGGYVQILAPPNVPGCGPASAPWDPAMRGFQGELFVGGEFYPLAIMSFGVSGRVGFGHVEGEWCVPGRALDPQGNDPADAPMDVSSDSFSVGAQGEIGFHF